MPTKQKGYTLAEILIVVTIIVILGLIVLVGINPLTQIFKAYDAHRKADLNKIKIALENYYSDHDCYPNFQLTGVLDAKGKPSYACGDDFLTPYLASLPCDPSTNSPYALHLLPTGSTCPQQFAIYAQISLLSDDQATKIPCHPQVIAVYSPNLTPTQLATGCSGVVASYYGCKSSVCEVIAHEGDPPPLCTPNYYEDPTCSRYCSPAKECR